jgi:hypothetical protein
MFPEALYRVITEDRAAELAEIARIRQTRDKKEPHSMYIKQSKSHTLKRSGKRAVAWFSIAMLGALLVGCEKQDDGDSLAGAVPVFAPALAPQFKRNPHVSVYSLSGQLITNVAEVEL